MLLPRINGVPDSEIMTDFPTPDSFSYRVSEPLSRVEPLSSTNFNRYPKNATLWLPFHGWIIKKVKTISMSWLNIDFTLRVSITYEISS
ncbi:hypothetical protein CEXT_636441 [Caerostris extrusa]|uniref:Uncharacterized protein n=1 Tax=Caerostris extrusa TaxID=172846 RepID=A0AAV4XBE0_CAEEX|nr:hypothetical protein CEXT_636441 [Caerostris extrusa]